MPKNYLEEMFDLSGKTAVVTGGAGVLGTDMAVALARAGANVAIWDVREDALAVAAKSIEKEAGRAGCVLAQKVDLMDEKSMRSGVEGVLKKWKRFEVLVNACGGNRGKGPLVETKIEDFEFVLKLNLIAGCFMPMKIIGEYWIREKIAGTIINIASMASYIPLSGVWAYSASKAAVMNQTMAAAKELAPHGIRVNAIAPGFFLGEQNRRLLTNEDGSLTPRGQDVVAHTPFGRFGEASELMGTVLFLASDKAAGFVTGITVPVDGGYLIQNI